MSSTIIGGLSITAQQNGVYLRNVATGMRYSELIGLKWGDIVEIKGTIKV